MDTQELLEFVNLELSKGTTLTQIAKNLGKNESTIRKRLNKEGYRRIGNKFVLNIDTTHNITSDLDIKKEEPLTINTSSNTKEIVEKNNDIDMDKLRLLLDNVDRLLSLIPNTSSSISLNTDKTKVTSLRINEDLYSLVKSRAIRDNCSISEIVNKSLMDYLNNYL